MLKPYKTIGFSFAFFVTGLSAAAVDPLTTRWTFGAHEPYSMYRRMGKKSTGGIDGSAKWLGEYSLSGNPDIGTFFRGKAVIPAGHQGLIMEK